MRHLDSSRTISYVRDAHVTSAYLDSGLALMSVEQGRYYRLNVSGSEIWRLLEVPRSKTELVDEMTRDFDVSRAECIEDVERFISELTQQGLLRAIYNGPE